VLFRAHSSSTRSRRITIARLHILYLLPPHFFILCSSCYCLLQIKSKTMSVMPATEDAATPVASGVSPGVGWVYLQPAPVTLVHYRHKQSIGLGAAQIVLGSLCIVFNGIALGIGIYDGLGFVGHGFWCGVLVSVHPSSSFKYVIYTHRRRLNWPWVGGQEYHMTIFRAKISE